MQKRKEKKEREKRKEKVYNKRQMNKYQQSQIHTTSIKENPANAPGNLK